MSYKYNILNTTITIYGETMTDRELLELIAAPKYLRYTRHIERYKTNQ